ncbi:MAG: membrane lipoprotein lipid attachment site-containing protein [bacterium]|nr:membrane lipoprotein lipid attachment site-containing protein [bacterium]
MKKLLFVFGFLAILASCSDNKSSANTATLDTNVHKVVALEAINTTKYTYIKVSENGAEKWIACPLASVVIGKEYYYGNEMPMANFESKELNKVFPMVYFVEGISTEPPVLKEGQGNGQNMNPQPMGQNPAPSSAPEPAAAHVGSAGVVSEKLAVEVKPAKGGITIAELNGNMKKYAGKTVTIKGKVTKFNPEVMDRNWVHLQDGTEVNGKFDITLTTLDNVAVGDEVTFTGKIVLNKDFGAGYIYEVIMEEAKLKK